MNIWGAQLWPKIQNVLLVFHCVFFVVVIVVLWAKAPHQSASAVFTGFTNEGGWSSMGLSLMVGQITGIYSLIGMSPSVASVTPKIPSDYPQAPTQQPICPKKSP
jgi:ABC-type sulfate transport system permease component